MSDFEELHADVVEQPDEREIEARDDLRGFFRKNRGTVFFSRQLEVLHEDKYFHWITNRAIRDLEAEGEINSEWRPLRTGTLIKLVCHRSYRFYKRGANQLVKLVEEYSDPNIGGSLGLHGETMVLEGFARTQFVMVGRDVSEYKGKSWQQSKHNLDFIFERDERAYGSKSKTRLVTWIEMNSL